jgi:2-oxo-4-hydroxy-4-carboxy-5-ureidoimidazoline decarboxylase
MTDTLERFNELPDDKARAALSSCCGCKRWVDAMLAERPFSSLESAFAAAAVHWSEAGRADVLEAMSHHPRIGASKAPPREAAEQAGAAGADAEIKAAMAAGNRAYEARFGHIYLVCASGKSGAELLELLRGRLGNDPDTELMIAAAEQGKITRLRLDKLLGGSS